MTTHQIQLLLLYLGYSPGSPDGIDGPTTQAAVKQFQRDFGGITVDGLAGEETQKALKHAVAYGFLKKEDSSATGGDSNVPTKTGTFWDEIQYFTREEFKCKCGGQYCDGYPAEPEEKLVRAAVKVREHFGVPVTISSGLRCPTHNKNSNGVYNSRHLTGKAMDFSVRGFSASSVLAYVQSLPEIRYSYAINGTWVHMDII